MSNCLQSHDHTVHGILQIRILEWVAFPFAGSAQIRGQTQVSHIGGGFFTSWATREALYAEWIMCNANVGLDEAQAGIKTVGRNINNLRYADDTTIMAESEQELKSLLLKVKEDIEKIGLKLNIQKTKIMASGPISSRQIDGETLKTVTDFIFLGSKIRRWWLQPWN